MLVNSALHSSALSQLSLLLENLLKNFVRFAGRGCAGRFHVVVVPALDFQRELLEVVMKSTLPHPSLLDVVVQALYCELRVCAEGLQWTPGIGEFASRSSHRRKNQQTCETNNRFRAKLACSPREPVSPCVHHGDRHRGP